MYKISRNCDTNHLISLKFIEGHSTSRMKRVFWPRLYTRVFSCFVLIFQRATVFFKGEGGKLRYFSGAMLYPTLSGVNVYFVDDVSRW